MTTPNTPDSNEALKPCPFCGVRMIRSGLDQPHWQQWWEHEDRETSDCALKNQTISDTSKVYKAAWNRRASFISKAGDVDLILQRLVETPAGERIRMRNSAADLRSVIIDVLEHSRASVAATPTTPSAAAMRAAEVKVVLERVARCVYIDEPPCWCNESNDENVEHDTNCLVARDYWASLTILHSTDDALANEVQSRVNLVAEAAVEWYQAGREGGECFDAAEKLSATINSLLELRSKPDAAASSETETEHERLRRTFAYERVRFHHDPNNTYLVVNVTNENMLELEGMAGEFAPSLFKKVGGKETTPFVAATPSPETAIDLARADGYRDGFRHGKQSRAAPLPAAVDDEGECPFCERMVAIEYKMEGRFAAHEAPTDRSHQCVGSYAVASRELLRSGDKS